jgi:hypothetical protein
MPDLIAPPHAYRASLDPMDQGDCALCGHSRAAHADPVMEMALTEAESSLWRIQPNIHTISCSLNNHAQPDPFEGPGETWEAAAHRHADRARVLQSALAALARSVTGLTEASDDVSRALEDAKALLADDFEASRKKS